MSGKGEVAFELLGVWGWVTDLDGMVLLGEFPISLCPSFSAG
jgi:hypothetical protein